MKIGLIDVDGHNFPKLALMKIAAHHKQNGDQVEWCFPFYEYDKVYMSKVFDFTPDYNTAIRAGEIITGGTGYGLENTLPDEIEQQFPDYSLYGITNKVYGFMTRGCPRQCPFCIVSKKEGSKSRKVAELNQFWDGQKEIILLDPNILACPHKNDLLQQLVASQSWVDFTQGLDIRLMTERDIELIKQIKIKMLHFAWDRMQDADKIQQNLKDFKEATQIDFRKARVYVLANYETTHDEDLHRIYKLRELGYDPYVMIYDKATAPKQTKKMARWVNNKFIFRKCARFDDYEA